MIARCNLAISKWEEAPYDSFSEGKKLTQASVVFDLTGDLKGKAFVEYLMVYTPAGATYVGLMKIDGELGGKKGSFVMEDRGVFKDGACQSTLVIVPESGTGALEHLSGKGHYKATHTTNELELTY